MQTDIIRVGIAAIPSRMDTLEKTIASIYPYVDEICVNINGWDPEKAIPFFLQKRRIRCDITDNLGDLMKFKFLEGFEGYYFTCDDDIEYSEDFIVKTINAIERYKRKAVIGWHGSILKEPFYDYYDKDCRDVYTFRSKIVIDKIVDVLGTGVMGFHTDTIRPPMDIFTSPSMADVFFAKYAREQDVPLILTAHEANKVIPLETTSSISGDSIARKNSELNVGENVKNLALELLELPASNKSLPAFLRPLNVAIIGRVSDGRWLKGGILKSCRMMSEMLDMLCWQHQLIEIDSPIEDIKETLRAENFDAVIIYTGDQNAQDFYAVPAVPAVTDAALESGAAVLLNLSIDGHPERTADVIGFVKARSQYKNLFIMTFTNGLGAVLDHASIADRFIMVPKTLETLLDHEPRPFLARSGVFLGDVGKLCNPRLTERPLEYITALKDAAGDMPLDCVMQYTVKDIPAEVKDLVNIIPYQPDILERFRQYRLCVHLYKYCTFEMLPVEAMSAGLPVAYVDMPHSLNEYIGSSGIKFNTPDELHAAATYLLNNELAWRSFHLSGQYKSISQGIKHQFGQLGAAIISAVTKTENSAGKKDG